MNSNDLEFNPSPFSRRVISDSETLLFMHERQPIERNKEQLEKYRERSLNDFQDILKYLFWIGHQRFQKMDFVHCRGIGCTADPKFGASVSLNPGNGKVTAIVNLGTFFALEDFFMSILSNGRIFGNILPEDAQETNLNSYGFIAPIIRFYDYNHSGNWGLKVGECIGNSWIYGFFSSYSHDVNVRNISALLVQINLTWVITHEEAHFTEGHLNYEMSHFAGRKSEMSLNGCRKGSSRNDHLCGKIFEWQADKKATTDTLALFYNDATLLPSKPSQGQTDKEEYVMTSLFISSLCFTSLIFQKSINNNSEIDDDYHPKPQTRLLTTLITALKEIIHRSLPTKMGLPGQMGEAVSRPYPKIPDDQWDDFIWEILSNISRCVSFLNEGTKYEHSNKTFATSNSQKSPDFLDQFVMAAMAKKTQTDEFGIFDNEIEMKIVHTRLLSIVFPDRESSKEFCGNQCSTSEEKILAKWFGELDNEITPNSRGVLSALQCHKPNFE